MRRLTRRAFLGVGGCAVGLGLAACHGGDESVPNEPTNPSAGKLGGKLVIYTTNDENLINAVIPAFEEKYGVAVSVTQAESGTCFDTLRGEKDSPVADVMWGSSYHWFAGNEDLFQAYVAEENSDVPEEWRNTSGYYTPYCLEGSVIVLNKTLCAGLDVAGYADLLSEKLAGKIALADPNTSSSGFAHLTNVLAGFGGYESDDAWAFVQKLMASAGGAFVARSSEVYGNVAEALSSVGLSYEGPCEELAENGADVQVVYPREGCVFLSANSAITKGCDNLSQAQAWNDYLVTQACQQLIASETAARPVRDDVTPREGMQSLGDINVIAEDYDYVIKHSTDILATFNKVVAGTWRPNSAAMDGNAASDAVDVQ